MNAKPGFSLRESLINQGVTCELATRQHILYANEMSRRDASFSIRNYKVDKSNPNKVPNTAFAA